MKKISCIIPVYNVEEFVIECLESVYSQDYPNKELIIVNDGSTDNSSNLIKEWIKDKTNIIFKTIPNSGPSVARNYGIDLASGEYITFIDSDDVLLDKDIFSKVINILESNTECDIVQYNMILKWNSEYAQVTKYEYGRFSTLKEKAMAYSKATIHGSCCDKVFRSTIFKTVQFTQGFVAEDIYIIPELILNSHDIIVSNVGNYGYRYRPGSRSKKDYPYDKYVSIIHSFCRYWAFLDQFDFCHKNFYSSYVNFIWGKITVLTRSYSRAELDRFYSSKIFIRKSLFEWLTELKNIKGFMLQIKSLFVFVLGPRYIDYIKRQ